MIRLTLLVVAVYGISCAMAWGQVAPPARAGERDSAGQASRSAGDSQRPQSSGPLRRDNGGSLLAAEMSAPTDPDRVKYSDSSINILAVPEPKPKVIKKHDLVTIIIQENSESSTKGTTDLKKNADLDMKIDSYVRLNLAQLAIKSNTPSVAPELKAEGTRDFKGDAQVDRSDTFTGRIGAEVLDVKPNGTLVIQARKRIKTDEEVQEFVLTGVCRAEDVTPDNAVLSNQLHDLDVHKVTQGAARDTTKRGWVPRLLDFVNPF